MKLSTSTLPLLVLLFIIIASSSVNAASSAPSWEAMKLFPGLYDPKDVAFEGLSLHKRDLPPPTNSSDMLNYSYYMSSYEPIHHGGALSPPSSRKFASVPIFISQTCVAFNVTALLSVIAGGAVVDTNPIISLTTLGKFLTGTLGGDWQKSVTAPDALIQAGIHQLRLIIAKNSKVTRSIVSRLHMENIPGFEASAVELPASVLANPNITFVDTDDEVIDSLESSWKFLPQIPVGFVSRMSGKNFQCASVSLQDDDTPVHPSMLPDIPASRFSLTPDPTLASSPTAFDLLNRVDFNVTITRVPGELMYPFVFFAFQNIPLFPACDQEENIPLRIQSGIDSLTRIAALSMIDGLLLRWAARSLSTQYRSLLLSSAFTIQQECQQLSHTSSSSNSIYAGGSTAFAAMMYEASIAYLSDTQTAVSHYLPEGTDVAFENMVNGRYRLGLTETPLTAEQQDRFKSGSQAPLQVWPIAVVANLPGNFPRVFIDRCSLVRIFRGEIKLWSDPALQKFNPGLSLPHLPVTVIVPTFKTGTNLLLQEQLRHIDLACHGSSDIVPDYAWTMHYDQGFASGPAALDAIRATPYSIGVGAKAGVMFDSSLIEVNLVNTTDLSVTNSDSKYVAAALELASIVDESTGDFEISRAATDSSSWPFVSKTYFIVETSNPSDENCSEIRIANELAYYILTSDHTASLATANGYGALNEKLQENGKRKLIDSTCGSLFLFPELRHNTTELDLDPIIGGSVAGFAVLLILFVLFCYYLANRGKKSDKYAVKDSTTPMALIFTDIQASTTLWSVAPKSMALALDLHNEILDRNIEKYSAYKVKTIGDAYMICVNDIKNAHNLCLDIQRDLHNAEWPSDEIDMAYADLFQDEESPYQIYTSDGNLVSQASSKEKGYNGIAELYMNRTNPNLFRGVSIRIGMTWGVAEPKCDEVTNAYDYYGPNVNLASRCESCGNGGQTVYSVHAIEALRDAGVDLTDTNKISVVPLGKQQLKGIPAPTELYQVLPAQLALRRFPPLRLLKDSATTLQLEEESATTTSLVNNNSTAASRVNITNDTNSTKAAAGGDSTSHHNNNSSAFINIVSDSSRSSAPPSTFEDEDVDATSIPFPELRFAKYLSKTETHNSVDPRLLLFAYDCARGTISAEPCEKKRCSLIDQISKQWRLADFKTKQHAFFKKELGYEVYWTLRISARMIGFVNRNQRHRDSSNKYDINVFRILKKYSAATENQQQNNYGFGGKQNGNNNNVAGGGCGPSFFNSSISSSSQGGNETPLSGGAASGNHTTTVTTTTSQQIQQQHQQFSSQNNQVHYYSYHNNNNTTHSAPSQRSSANNSYGQNHQNHHQNEMVSISISNLNSPQLPSHQQTRKFGNNNIMNSMTNHTGSPKSVDVNNSNTNNNSNNNNEVDHSMMHRPLTPSSSLQSPQPQQQHSSSTSIQKYQQLTSIVLDDH